MCILVFPHINFFDVATTHATMKNGYKVSLDVEKLEFKGYAEK